MTAASKYTDRPFASKLCVLMIIANRFFEYLMYLDINAEMIQAQYAMIESS